MKFSFPERVNALCEGGEQMSLINPPEKTPQFVTHHTFHSRLIGRDIGYNIYLPDGYSQNGQKYPVVYHLHGYMENESSHIFTMEKVYKSRQAITVFVNATEDNGYLDYKLPIESIIITELIPHIDAQYQTIAAREGRALSGWSMGAAGAFYYAVKYLNLFHQVTAYSPTFHHFFYDGYSGFEKPLEEAAGLYESMKNDDACFDKSDVMKLRQNADSIRNNLSITLRVGIADPLVCENEIMHLYLNTLNIPHQYEKIAGAGHKLDSVI